MEDKNIIELFWNRDEVAVHELAYKYGTYLNKIAGNILHSDMDIEETLQDTYLSVWHNIPPERPNYLKAYLAKIVRNLSLKKVRDMSAAKRGGSVFAVAEELSEFYICDDENSDIIQTWELSEIIDRFLRGLPQTECNVFVCRYWYYDSISDICTQFNMGESRVKMMLLRTRKKLAKYLEKEGVTL